MIAPEMRCPAPRDNADRAEFFIRNDGFHSKSSFETEDDFAVLFVARRYRVALPIARAIVALASLGRAFT